MNINHHYIVTRPIPQAWFVKPRESFHNDDALIDIAQPLSRTQTQSSHTTQVHSSRLVKASAAITNPELDCVQHTAHTTDYATDLQALRDAVASGSHEQIVAAAKQLVANAEPQPNHSAQLLTVEQIAMKLNLCTRSIWRMVANGELPPPIPVGHSRRWFATDIYHYLEGKRHGIQRRRRS